MTAASPPSATRWIHGPVPDLLVGCGGLYLLVPLLLPLLVSSGPYAGLPSLAPFALLLVSIPHYGGTLLRVYEQRDERRRYAVFTVYATALLVGWFAVGSQIAWIGSLMVTLYLTWSPWHYSGQNYGIALMLLGRRGVEVSRTAKRALYASYVFSFLLTALYFHVAPADGSSTGLRDVIELVPLGLPRDLVAILFPAVALAWIASLLVVFRLLLAKGSLRDLAPAALLSLTQAAWFAVPFSLAHFELIPKGPRVGQYFTEVQFWVAIAHAAQYLWITSYYARKSAGWSSQPTYFAKTLLAGSLAWSLPLLVFAPWALGSVGFASGFPLLVAAVVNLQHFVLDGAIWKLRSGKVASILILNRSDAHAAVPAVSGTPWVRHAVWSVALVCTLLQAFSYLRADVWFPIAVGRGDLVSAERVLAETGWLGGDTVERRLRLAALFQRAGQPERAIEQYRGALALRPDVVIAHVRIGEILAKQNRFYDAAQSYRDAVRLQPAVATARLRLGQSLHRLGELGPAISELTLAIALEPELAEAHVALADALLEDGESDRAALAYRRALELQPDLPTARASLARALGERDETAER